MKVKLIKRIVDWSMCTKNVETNEEFQNRINEFLSTHRCNPPVFLSVDLCHINYEED